MAIRFPRILQVVPALLLVCVVVAACSPSSSSQDSPASAANSIVTAYRTGAQASGRTFFMNPSLYDELVEMIPDGTTLRVDNENLQDPGNATVDVLFGLKPGADGFTLVMSKINGGWKVITFMPKNG